MKFCPNLDSSPSKDKNREYLADLQDGDIVGHFHNRFDIKRIEFTAIIFRCKSNFSAFYIRDIHITRGAEGGTRGLKQSRRERTTFRKLVELFGAVVIDKNVKREHILDSADGEMLVEEHRHGGVVESEDGYSETTVDFACEMSDGEVVVKGTELGVFGEDSGNVVSLSSGGE